MYSINSSILRWYEVILPQKAGSLYKILHKKNNIFLFTVLLLLLFMYVPLLPKNNDLMLMHCL